RASTSAGRIDGVASGQEYGEQKRTRQLQQDGDSFHTASYTGGRREYTGRLPNQVSMRHSSDREVRVSASPYSQQAHRSPVTFLAKSAPNKVSKHHTLEGLYSTFFPNYRGNSFVPTVKMFYGFSRIVERDS